MRYLKMKRIFDVLFSIIGVLFFILIYPFVTILIRIDSKGPIIFKQERVGLHGKHYYIYKFRTMCNDADYRRHEVQGKSDNGFIQTKYDPRITKAGIFLRKTSIDEIPQFFNVLKGDMSIIGPRPLIPEEVAILSENHKRRQKILPGITGYAQVRGRSYTPMDEREIFDIYYIDHISLWTDIKIVVRTLFVLVRIDVAI